MSQPSLPTVKRLFAVSGNKCAFPRCNHPLVDASSGKVTGRVCHIKGRQPNAPRYDPKQTDNERHAFENLILMCPIHHDVIDSDPNSYTARRLQEIKAEHEAENAGGSEASDDIALQLLVSTELSTQIALTAEGNGVINWTGDVIHGTKVVASPADTPQGNQLDDRAHLESLITDIQTALYGDDSRLPYVLTLCLDLCERVGLSGKYGQWLNRELGGYSRDQKRLQNGFGDEEQFQSWMERWASHRLVETSVKIWNRPPMGRPGIVSLPFERVFVPYPVAEIARISQNQRESGELELSMVMYDLGADKFNEFKSTISGILPGVDIPPDLRVFISVSSLEQVLGGVRSIVLSLLSDARHEIAGRNPT